MISHSISTLSMLTNWELTKYCSPSHLPSSLSSYPPAHWSQFPGPGPQQESLQALWQAVREGGEGGRRGRGGEGGRRGRGGKEGGREESKRRGRKEGGGRGRGGEGRREGGEEEEGREGVGEVKERKGQGRGEGSRKEG